MMPVYMNPKMSLFVSKDLLVTKKMSWQLVHNCQINHDDSITLSCQCILLQKLATIQVKLKK